MFLLRQQNKGHFFFAAIENFAAATKHFVVVTKYFCCPYFSKWFCWYNKAFYAEHAFVISSFRKWTNLERRFQVWSKVYISASVSINLHFHRTQLHSYFK